MMIRSERRSARRARRTAGRRWSSSGSDGYRKACPQLAAGRARKIPFDRTIVVCSTNVSPSSGSCSCSARMIV